MTPHDNSILAHFVTRGQIPTVRSESTAPGHCTWTKWPVVGKMCGSLSLWVVRCYCKILSFGVSLGMAKWELTAHMDFISKLQTCNQFVTRRNRNAH
jgi:hypothetical protein